MDMKRLIFILLFAAVFVVVIGVGLSIYSNSKKEKASATPTALSSINPFPITKESPGAVQSSSPEQSISPGGSTSGSTGSSESPSGSFVPPVGEKITTKDKNGNDVSVTNVYNMEIQRLSRNGVAFRDNADYYMAYYPIPQPGFVITLSNSNVRKAREAAEKDFLEILGISKEQACQLHVSLAVPNSVNAKASGVDYNLSFCPDGIPLP